MKKIFLAVALALAAGTALPQQPRPGLTLEQLQQQLEALSTRVEKLEQDKASLEARNAELATRNDRLEATSDYLRANASATRRELAEDAPQVAKIAELEKQAKASAWAANLAWKGDMRYRHERVDPEEATEDQTRHRIRARVGFTARVNDTVTGTFQLATTGGNSDPRSTNQTLGDGLSRKAIGIDLAYLEWKPSTGVALQAGKTNYGWQRVGSLLWDGDLTWEGGLVKFERGPFFANASGAWLSESATSAEATLLAAQLGARGSVGGVKLMGALSYHDVGAVQNRITTTATGCTALPAFFGGPQGNTTYAAGGCTRLRHDYDLVEAIAQAEFRLGALPLVVFADYLQNQAVGSEDRAYAVGATLGKAGTPGTWEFGYLYQNVDKDAQFGQFTDSDFGGGVTDASGSVFRLAFAPATNWVVNGTWSLNQRFNTAVMPRDYDRIQLDLNFKF